ncbi:hypothetical protein ACFYYH_13810 [Streptomyces sp. NPDC002018]|uniref:hypothetical protein n=1 Tax=Streptomyces sp. NPDC002018 TaxID=3364629 RepID=UPI0036831711
MTESGAEKEPVRLRPWYLFVRVTLFELVGLLIWGALTLVTLQFGSSVSLELAAGTAGMFAADTVVDHYRAKPPRRRAAAAAALLTWAGTTVLADLVAGRFLPETLPDSLGFFVGYLVGLPCGAVVFARVVNRASAV